jgi:hypothetical protein
MGMVIREHHRDQTDLAEEDVDRAIKLMSIVDDLVYLWIYSETGAAPKDEELAVALNSLDRQVLYRSFGLTIQKLSSALDSCVRSVEEKRVLFGIPRLDPIEHNPEE